MKLKNIIDSQNFLYLRPPVIANANFGVLAFFLSACGGNRSAETFTKMTSGFASIYVPPSSNYSMPSDTDPNFKILEPLYSDPYWTRSLAMDNGKIIIEQVLDDYNRILNFAFPNEFPNYLPVTISGWAPSNETMIAASREIFVKLEAILDVNFNITEDINAYNAIVISQSVQAATAGYSYFPNTFYKIGSDIFISKEYSNPIILTSGMTNYDYEVLIHEIGHALGLKHPFEADGVNYTILNEQEDHTEFTVMSYDQSLQTFDGTFRNLDWMALTEFYGVNPSYKSENNTYTFDDKGGIFIIDGGGIDTIDASESTKNIFLDLRAGTHSYEGTKSNFITDPYQLTISHGSNIENLLTGFGNDYVIGNRLPNLINTSAGNDQIFAGSGADTIHLSLGSNTIDLSEEINFQDRLIFDISYEDLNYDTIFGFSQGESGDILEIKNLDSNNLKFLPLVDLMDVPVGGIANSVVRIFGENLNEENSLEEYFADGNLLENLKLYENETALLITANSQKTGDTQNLFMMQNKYDFVHAQHISSFVGNYLDIDSWSSANIII